MDSCQGLGKRKRNQIEQVLEKLEYSEWSLEEMQVILNNIRRILGDELLSSREILKTQLQSIKTCFNFDKEKDRICFVLDRDYSSFSENQYDEVIEICKEENFDLGITSPNFEFYLLLHLIPLNNENRDKIFMNVDNFSEKRMKEAMFEMFGEIYKKEKYNADLIINRFNDYKVHIEAYSTNPKELKSKVGSSLGTIIEELIKYSNISSSS